MDESMVDRSRRPQERAAIRGTGPGLAVLRGPVIYRRDRGGTLPLGRSTHTPRDIGTIDSGASRSDAIRITNGIEVACSWTGGETGQGIAERPVKGRGAL